VTIKGQGYLGLFGQVEFGGEVRNLSAVDVNIAGSGAEGEKVKKPVKNT
jgi:hypothetical protein